MDKEKIEKLLEEHIQEAIDSAYIGSGDDLFYVEQVKKYKLECIDKQRRFWIDYGVKIIQESSKELDSLIDEARGIINDAPIERGDKIYNGVRCIMLTEKISRMKRSTEVFGEVFSQKGSMKKSGEE